MKATTGLLQDLRGILTFLVFNQIILLNSEAANNFSEPCKSQIYCYGDLLETIQLNKLFIDDKTFVDRPLKLNSSEILDFFQILNIKGDTNGNATAIQMLKDFVEEHFEVGGAEFEEWDPKDWIQDPDFLTNIKDQSLRTWGSTLHNFWKELGKKIKLDVLQNPFRYSMIYVSHPVIVPGGRFKEFYYWDSYWIQKGLLISEMYTTVEGMIENFMEMVETIGYVPNGGRIYYERSQPPLLLPMIKNYYGATKNVTFIERHIDTMQKEFNFFMKNRTVTFDLGGVSHTLARYNVNLKGPRPEAYRKDYELVHPLNIPEEEKEIMYANLKAGAESGWDFSSRWFVIPEGEKGNLSHTKTRDIIPVDLNGFLYWNAVILTEFCELVNNSAVCDATIYREEASRLKQSIKDVLWDEETGSWYDYDFQRKELRKQFYPSNIVPLWVKAHHDNSTVSKIIKNFEKFGATKFPGGIPTSMEMTGEQWDFPNGWPPLNHMVVEALEYSGTEEGKTLAFNLAQTWTRSNYKAYTQTELMFEKYDVTIEGASGGGGEYEVVIGFGWTNGVILDFLKMYGDRLTSSAVRGANHSIGFIAALLMTSVILRVMSWSI